MNQIAHSDSETKRILVGNSVLLDPSHEIYSMHVLTKVR